jgi:hypothetical protein
MSWRDWFRKDKPPFWPRPQVEPGESQGRLRFEVYGAPAGSKVPADLRPYGHAEAKPPAEVLFRRVERSARPGVFDQGIQERISTLPADKGPLHAQLQALVLFHEIEAAWTDQGDHRQLQAAWSLVRCLVDHGATGVYDATAGKWRDIEMVRVVEVDPSRDARRYQVLGRPLPSHPGGSVLWTHGLAKVARPDLLCLVPDGLAPHAAHLLDAVGEAATRGLRPTPGRNLREDQIELRFEVLQPNINGPDLPEWASVDPNPNGVLKVDLFQL